MSEQTAKRAEQRRAKSKKRRKPQGADEPASASSKATKATATSTDEPAARRKKKKRKRAKRRPDADDRPPFARGYPRDEALDDLVRAFETGNFAAVRAGAPALIDGEDVDEDVRTAARDLRRRIDPAPTSVYIWAIGVCLLVFLYGYYLSHGH